MTEQDFLNYPTGKISKNEFCRHCCRHNSRYTVCNVIIVKNNKVLLELRNNEPQKEWWALCGGYINWDETVLESAKREAKEELGYELNDIKFFKIYDDIHRDLDGRQNISHCFIANVTKDPPRIDNCEVKGFRFFDLDDLPEKIGFDHRKMIEDYKTSIKK